MTENNIVRTEEIVAVADATPATELDEKSLEQQYGLSIDTTYKRALSYYRGL
jgi:hypothetical protein